jgi:hypothetical protein
MQNDPVPSTTRKSHFTRAACWGAVITFLVSLSILVIRVRGRMTPVDSASLNSAEQRWQQANITDYDLEIEISERQRRHFRIEVRDSHINAIWHNDRPRENPERYQAWTIEGMFQVIRTDVDQQLQSQPARTNSAVSGLTIRAEFHPTHGFPQRYIRVEHRQQGNNPEISWKITSFETRE